MEKPVGGQHYGNATDERKIRQEPGALGRGVARATNMQVFQHLGRKFAFILDEMTEAEHGEDERRENETRP